MYWLYVVRSIPFAFFAVAAPAIRAADRADTTIKVMMVYLEDPTGVEVPSYSLCDGVLLGSSDVHSPRVHQELQRSAAGPPRPCHQRCLNRASQVLRAGLPSHQVLSPPGPADQRSSGASSV